MEKKEIALILSILGFAVFVVLILLFAPQGNGSDDDDTIFPFWLIPIWFVVMIPAFQKNKEKPKHEVSKALKIFIAALLLGIFFALLFIFL